MRFLVSFLVVVCGAAQSPSDPNAVLEQARARLQAMTSRLEQYVCIETVNRQYFRPILSRNAPVIVNAPPACGGGAAASSITGERRQLESTDRLRLEVTVSQARELHAWPGATGFDTRDVDELIRDGPVSTGSFGGYLASIFGSANVPFHFNGERTFEGRKVYEYAYRVPLESSRFVVKVSGAWLPTAYDGTFWLDPQSLNLLRLTIHADQMPSDAAFCQADTTLDYQMLHIGNGDVLLPRQGQLDIVNKNGRETRNDTSFSNCREYQAESALSFDLPADAKSTVAPRTGFARLAVPLGLPVTLSLETPIDTDTAATGDAIAAKVLKPVRRTGSTQVLIPAGAIVRGRIRRVETHMLPKPYYLIAFAFNRVEVNGALSPFAARSEPDPALSAQLGANLEMRATGIWYWDVGTFLFPTSKPHFVLPAGFESKWFTLATGR